MSVCVQYPSAGCIVEYLEGNAIQIALVTEESGGKLRLLLPNRRETRLTTSVSYTHLTLPTNSLV